MFTIPLEEILGKLPTAELECSLEEFAAPMLSLLPDKRLREVGVLAVQGILAGQSPVITKMAQSVSRLMGDPWPTAKRLYRLLDNPRFDHETLFDGLYEIGRRTVLTEEKPYLVVAVDPVNFEKPYTEKMEGVSHVRKSTPPSLDGSARITRGYPAITATVVNTRVPAITYANWFSYMTFVSENREIHRAIEQTRSIFQAQQLRFVGDAGLDDRKIFGWIAESKGQFVIRASHLERLVEVYNHFLDRWEPERLGDMVDTIPWKATFQVAFTHAGRTRFTQVKLGWLLLRLPDTHQHIWMIVAEQEEKEKPLVLLTNVPLEKVAQVQKVYSDWRLRTRIEHGYRFHQEQGLDVEDVRVRTLERMRRVFALVLLAAQFVFFVMENWPTTAVHWLRQLGGKLGLTTDRDGPYVLLCGMRAIYQTVAALTHLATKPFPHGAFTYG